MQTDVTKSESWKKLANLAEAQFDLSADQALAGGGRVQQMICRAAGLRLLYATQRLDQQVLAAFQAFADEHELVARFQAMRRGAVLNRIIGWESENRQVLHTSSRDLFSAAPREAHSAA